MPRGGGSGRVRRTKRQRWCVATELRQQSSSRLWCISDMNFPSRHEGRAGCVDARGGWSLHSRNLQHRQDILSCASEARRMRQFLFPLAKKPTEPGREIQPSLWLHAPRAYTEMTALYPAPGKGMGIRYLRVSHRRTEKLSVLFSLKRAPCQSPVLAFNTSLQLNSTGMQRASSAGAALIKSLRILQTSGAITSICDYTRDLWAPRARIDTQNNNVMCSCAPAYPQDCCCCR